MSLIIGVCVGALLTVAGLYRLITKLFGWGPHDT
jgi:hypothetical protein